MITQALPNLKPLITIIKKTAKINKDGGNHRESYTDLHHTQDYQALQLLFYLILSYININH